MPGRTADVWGYGASYPASAAIATLALPFLVLTRRENAAADTPETSEATAVAQPA